MKEYTLKLTEEEMHTINYSLSLLENEFIEEANSIADKILCEECRMVNEK